jgi:hypothetical protein
VTAYHPDSGACHRNLIERNHCRRGRQRCLLSFLVSLASHNFYLWPAQTRFRPHRVLGVALAGLLAAMLYMLFIVFWYSNLYLGQHHGSQGRVFCLTCWWCCLSCSSAPTWLGDHRGDRDPGWPEFQSKTAVIDFGSRKNEPVPGIRARAKALEQFWAGPAWGVATRDLEPVAAGPEHFRNDKTRTYQGKMPSRAGSRRVSERGLEAPRHLSKKCPLTRDYVR